MPKISKVQSIHHTRSGVDGYYYQLPEVDDGTTVVYAEFTGEHGERTIGKKHRLYYILEGRAKFTINGEVVKGESGDLIVIPPYATYNLWPADGPLKVLLYMEYIKFDK